jgi:hypothetical protein
LVETFLPQLAASMMKYLLPCLIFFCLSSCSTLKKMSDIEISSGYYQYKVSDSRYAKVYVENREDSLIIIPIDKNGSSLKPLKNTNSQLFLKQSLDIDVLTVPFKFRPSSYNFPRQLTTDFNGNIFFGYRLDRYKVYTTKTPVGELKKTQHRALTFGGFGGVGATSSVHGQQTIAQPMNTMRSLLRVAYPSWQELTILL